MIRRCILGAIVATLAAITGCYGLDEPICDADQLHAVLETARPGDRIELGACTIEGSFSVPEDVTLIGRGADLTSICWSRATMASSSSAPALHD